MRSVGLPSAAALCAWCVLIASGCGTKSYSAWRPMPPEDAETLQSYYDIQTEGRDLVRRDVTVLMLFVFPATGYPEWGERFPDGKVVPFDRDELKKRHQQMSADAPVDERP